MCIHMTLVGLITAWGLCKSLNWFNGITCIGLIHSFIHSFCPSFIHSFNVYSFVILFLDLFHAVLQSVYISRHAEDGGHLHQNSTHSFIHSFIHSILLSFNTCTWSVLSIQLLRKHVTFVHDFILYFSWPLISISWQDDKFLQQDFIHSFIH